MRTRTTLSRISARLTKHACCSVEQNNGAHAGGGVGSASVQRTHLRAMYPSRKSVSDAATKMPLAHAAAVGVVKVKSHMTGGIAKRRATVRIVGNVHTEALPCLLRGPVPPSSGTLLDAGEACAAVWRWLLMLCCWCSRSVLKGNAAGPCACKAPARGSARHVLPHVLVCKQMQNPLCAGSNSGQSFYPTSVGIRCGRSGKRTCETRGVLPLCGTVPRVECTRQRHAPASFKGGWHACKGSYCATDASSHARKCLASDRGGTERSAP